MPEDLHFVGMRTSAPPYKPKATIDVSFPGGFFAECAGTITSCHASLYDEEMNPLLTLFLFAMSLLAIASACALLIYIYGELKQNRKELEAEKEQGAATLNEAKQVAKLLTKMQSSTHTRVSKPRKKTDAD